MRAPAGGSAKQARDRRFQAVLPLRGKILNVERNTDAAMYKNEEIAALIVALGLGLKGDAVPGLRYGKARSVHCSSRDLWVVLLLPFVGSRTSSSAFSCSDVFVLGLCVLSCFSVKQPARHVPACAREGARRQQRCITDACASLRCAEPLNRDTRR